MIKCDGYGKLLKLSFFGLLISFFTIFVGSSASAEDHFQVVGLSSSTSFVDSNYEITFLKGGGLNTLFLGTARNIFALASNYLFRRDENGMPYLYYNGTQGNFQVASSCDSLTSGGNYQIPSNCSSFVINTGVGPTIFKNFFDKVYQGDIVYYSFHDHGGAYWRQHFHLCFDSQDIGKSMCFDYERNYNHYLSMPLVDSKGLNITFATLPYGYVGQAPGQNGYLGQYEGSQGGGGYGEVSGFLTGSVFQQECTVGYAKNYAENMGMSSYLCYGGLPIDSNGLSVPVAGTGASVFEIFNQSNDGKNFQTWFQYWQNIYNNRLVYDQSVWSGTPAPLYSYFNFVSQYGPTYSAREIQDYCRIILNNMDLSSSWHGISSWCPQVYGNGGGGGGGSSISNWSDDTGTGIVSNSTNNNVNISVNWAGVGNHSGNEVKTPSAYIQDFFNKAREVIPTNFSDIGGGFLPTYIITFLCAIILFRFLRH